MSSFWRLLLIGIALVVSAPLMVILSSWIDPQTEIWRHLLDTQLFALILNSLFLVVGVGLGVLLLGTSLAGLTTLCEFPGRRWLDWALMLPMAIPAYVLAFVMVGLFEFTGPIQTALRAGWGTDLRLPDIPLTLQVIAVFTLVFYPYVYLLTRAALLSMGSSTMDVARTFGLNPFKAFFAVVLPMVRPAIVAGVALALMETLADFGAVSVFNYDTFTTAIYKTWFALFNKVAAVQLASLLLLFVALTLMGERLLRGRAQFSTSTNQPHRFQLSKWHARLATGFACLVLLLAFIIPVTQLLVWLLASQWQDLDARYYSLLTNTLLLGIMAAVITLSVVLLLAYMHKRYEGPLTKTAVGLSTHGYALPGSVLAIGILVLAKGTDETLAYFWLLFSQTPPTWALVGSLLLLLFAYSVRFMTVAFGPVAQGFASWRQNLHEAAQTLGAGHWQIIRRIYLPLLRPGIYTALLLVLVDVMKEMPATLMLRPFGWDTLAVRIYDMTSEGEWQRAALPALTLVLAGLIPVILLMRRSTQFKSGVDQ